MTTTVNKGDFVEIKYTGYSNEQIFDSNIEEDAKKVNPQFKPRKTILIVGEGMIVPGLDKAFEGKEIGKEYEVTISPKEGFGDRKRELVKTIPLNVFSERKIKPYPGLVLNMDNVIARIITVSGARVVTDFNNPLAGKELRYKFKIVRIVTDEKEKVETVLELLFKFIPEFDIKEKVIMKGPAAFKPYIAQVGAKFKDLIGKELDFEEVKPKEEKKGEKEEKNE